jgi:hypothetical protein
MSRQAFEIARKVPQPEVVPSNLPFYHDYYSEADYSRPTTPQANTFSNSSIPNVSYRKYNPETLLNPPKTRY